MKCFSCGKNFDYEKFYGICPKCGCYNKQETQEEHHKEMHKQYDNGYSHGTMDNYTTGSYSDGHGTSLNGNTYSQGTQGHTAGPVPQSPQVQIREVKQQSRGATIFLLISIGLFLLILVGGTAFMIFYDNVTEKRMQQEMLVSEVSIYSHDPGEVFDFQGFWLTVGEARSLITWEELDMPEGKKLIAVHMQGSRPNESTDTNMGYRMEDMYIECNGFYYEQISDYEYKPYGLMYHCPVIDPIGLCWGSSIEGWVGFLVDEDAQSVTLHLEEREGENLEKLVGIHRIDLKLEEGENDDEGN